MELVPIPVHFDAETVQTFYVGPASCGVPGTAAGLELALERFGSAPLGELVRPGIALAREGAPVNPEQAYILDILAPIHDRLPGTRELYAPRGRTLREGETFRFPELAGALERFGAEGAEPFYRGDLAAALSEAVVEGGGVLGPADLASYEAIERRPIRTPFRPISANQPKNATMKSLSTTVRPAPASPMIVASWLGGPTSTSVAATRPTARTVNRATLRSVCSRRRSCERRAKSRSSHATVAKTSSTMSRSQAAPRKTSCSALRACTAVAAFQRL